MTDLFLKAKHWQLFLLSFVFPLLIQFYFMWHMFSQMFVSMIKQSAPDPMIMMSYMQYFPMLIILFNAVLFLWKWSVAVGLQKKVPATVTMKVNKFKIFFLIYVLYMFLFAVGMSWMMSQMGTLFHQDTVPDMSLIPFVFMVIMPLHFFSIFCLLYCFYFVAKTIKTVELQREVQFSEFVAEFFLIWFYPIGVWILQPKINKFMEEQGITRSSPN